MGERKRNKKVFASAVQQALDKNGAESIKSRESFFRMMEDFPREYAREKEFLKEFADKRWLQICAQAEESDAKDLKKISRKATEYLCDRMEIDRKAARHLSKGMVVGIAACSQNRSVESVLAEASGKPSGEERRAGASEEERGGRRDAEASEKGRGGRRDAGASIPRNDAPGPADETEPVGILPLPSRPPAGMRVPGKPIAENEAYYEGEDEYYDEYDDYDDYDEYDGYGPGGRDESGKRRRSIAIAIVALAVILTGAGTAFALGFFDKEETVEVPDLTGMTVEEAKDAAEDVGLKAEEGPREESESVQKGHILRQSPSAGEEVEEGTLITIYASSGRRATTAPTSTEPDVTYTTVPDVEGMQFEAAQEKLVDAQLRCEMTWVDGRLARGIVVRQDKNGGARVPIGETVYLNVSNGSLRETTTTPTTEPQTTEPPTTEDSGEPVPDVTGYVDSLAAAKEIEAAGFIPVMDDFDTTDYSDDMIIEQAPEGGELAEPGSEVILVRANNPEERDEDWE